MWTTLGEVISIKSGNAIKVRNNKNGSFPIYGGNGISGYSDEYNIDKPTIVIGRVGFYCGSIHYVKSKVWVTDNAFITSIYGNVYDIDFLYYLLTYCNLRQYSNSTAQPVISGKTIYPVHVPVPPIKEQRKIVEKIEFWLLCISQLEFSQSKVKSTIKQVKSKILDLAIHGKLVQQDPNDEPASELLKRINPKAEITCDTPQYGKLPKGWCLIQGKYLYKPMKSTKPKGSFFNYIDIDSIDNAKQSIDCVKVVKTENAPSRASRHTQKGDIVFSMVRPYLKNIAIVPDNDCIASTGFYVCSPSNVEISKYCYYVMISDYTVSGLNQFMKGDNSPSINKSDIDNWLFPLPPLTEQHRIVAKIEELFAQLDKIEASL